ncbi:MAG TPA: hypothetical protein PLM00_05095 [Spirochaetota bacterium]|nr:hypothetical protein [Spirochaetota bacterium]HPN82745.1 hypothetical protein [Spirochaetota bacterium]
MTTPRRTNFPIHIDNQFVLEMIRRFQSGDLQARASLFKHLWRVICAWPRFQGFAGREECEWYLDAALERLFPALEHYRDIGRERFDLWFFTVLRNIWVDCLRKQTLVVGTMGDLSQLTDPAVALEEQEADPGVVPLRKLVSPRVWNCLCLRYPELIAEDEIDAFAGRWADGRRKRALVRLIEYARWLARRRRTGLMETLSLIQSRQHRMLKHGREQTTGWENLNREKERTLVRLRSDLVVLQYQTLTRLTGHPVGTIASIIHRARSRIALGQERINNPGGAKPAA